jgi:hypothetical protein
VNPTFQARRTDLEIPASLDGKLAEPYFEGPALVWLIPPSAGNFAFVQSSNIGIGNLGRNTARVQGYANFNLSAFRTFRVTERHRIQFRSEAFNALNHPNFKGPASTSIENAQYGLVTSAIPARQI